MNITEKVYIGEAYEVVRVNICEEREDSDD
jgi:hypothetical protein